jgi:hypothetical protein
MTDTAVFLLCEFVALWCGYHAGLKVQAYRTWRDNEGDRG